MRRALANDAGAVASIHVASWRETYAGIIPDSMLASLSVDHREAMWKRILTASVGADGTAVFLAEHDGSPIGFGSCGLQRDEGLTAQGFGGEISALYTRRAIQGRGFGLALMSAMFDELRGRGFHAASLWVLRDNARARAFYEKLGGQVVAEKEECRGNVVLREVAYGWRDPAIVTTACPTGGWATR